MHFVLCAAPGWSSRINRSGVNDDAAVLSCAGVGALAAPRLRQAANHVLLFGVCTATRSR